MNGLELIISQLQIIIQTGKESVGNEMQKVLKPFVDLLGGIQNPEKETQQLPQDRIEDLKKAVKTSAQAASAMLRIAFVASNSKDGSVAQKAMEAVKSLVGDHSDCDATTVVAAVTTIAIANGGCADDALGVINGLLNDNNQTLVCSALVSLGKAVPTANQKAIDAISKIRDANKGKNQLAVDVANVSIVALGGKSDEKKLTPAERIAKYKDNIQDKSALAEAKYVLERIGRIVKANPGNQEVAKAALDAIAGICADCKEVSGIAITSIEDVVKTNTSLAADAFAIIVKLKDNGVRVKDIITRIAFLGKQEECKAAAIDALKSISGDDDATKNELKGALGSLGVRDEEKKEKKKEAQKLAPKQIIDQQKEKCKDIADVATLDAVTKYIYETACKNAETEDKIGDYAADAIFSIYKEKKVQNPGDIAQYIKDSVIEAKTDANKAIECISGIWDGLDENSKSYIMFGSMLALMIYTLGTTMEECIDKAVEVMGKKLDEDKKLKDYLKTYQDVLLEIKKKRDEKDAKNAVVKDINSNRDKILALVEKKAENGELSEDFDDVLDHYSILINRCKDDEVKSVSLPEIRKTMIAALHDMAAKITTADVSRAVIDIAKLASEDEACADDALGFLDDLIANNNANINVSEAHRAALIIGSKIKGKEDKITALLNKVKSTYNASDDSSIGRLVNGDIQYFQPKKEEKKDEKKEEEKKQATPEDEINGWVDTATKQPEDSKEDKAKPSKENLETCVSNICLIATNEQNANVGGLGDKAIEGVMKIYDTHKDVIHFKVVMDAMKVLATGTNTTDGQKAIDNILKVWNDTPDGPDGKKLNSTTNSAAIALYGIAYCDKTKKQSVTDALNKLKEKIAVASFIENLIVKINNDDPAGKDYKKLLNDQKEQALNKDKKEQEDNVIRTDYKGTMENIINIVNESDKVSPDDQKKEVRKTAIEVMRDITIEKDDADMSDFFENISFIAHEDDENVDVALDGMLEVIDKKKDQVNVFEAIAEPYMMAKRSKDNVDKVVGFLNNVKDKLDLKDKPMGNVIDGTVNVLQPKQDEKKKREEEKKRPISKRIDELKDACQGKENVNPTLSAMMRIISPVDNQMDKYGEQVLKAYVELGNKFKDQMNVADKIRYISEFRSVTNSFADVGNILKSLKEFWDGLNDDDKATCMPDLLRTANGLIISDRKITNKVRNIFRDIKDDKPQLGNVIKPYLTRWGDDALEPSERDGLNAIDFINDRKKDICEILEKDGENADADAILDKLESITQCVEVCKGVSNASSVVEAALKAIMGVLDDVPQQCISFIVSVVGRIGRAVPQYAKCNGNNDILDDAILTLNRIFKKYGSEEMNVDQKEKIINAYDFITACYIMANPLMQGTVAGAEKKMENLLKMMKNASERYDDDVQKAFDTAITELGGYTSDKEMQEIDYCQRITTIVNESPSSLTLNGCYRLFRKILNVVEDAKKHNYKDLSSVANAAMGAFIDLRDNKKIDAPEIVIEYIGVVARMSPDIMTLNQGLSFIKSTVAGYNGRKGESGQAPAQVMTASLVNVPYQLGMLFPEVRALALDILRGFQDMDSLEDFRSVSGYLLDDAIEKLQHEQDKSKNLSPVDRIYAEKNKYAEKKDDDDDNDSGDADENKKKDSDEDAKAKEQRKKDKDLMNRAESMNRVSRIAIELAQSDYEIKLAMAAVDTVIDIRGEMLLSEMMAYLVAIMRANDIACDYVCKKLSELVENEKDVNDVEQASIVHILFEAGLNIEESRESILKTLDKMKDNAKNDFVLSQILDSIVVLNQKQQEDSGEAPDPVKMINMAKDRAIGKDTDDSEKTEEENKNPDDKSGQDKKMSDKQKAYIEQLRIDQALSNIQKIALEYAGISEEEAKNSNTEINTSKKIDPAKSKEVGDAAVSALNDIFKGNENVDTNNLLTLIWILTINTNADAATALDTMKSIVKDADLATPQDKADTIKRKANPQLYLRYLKDIGKKKDGGKDKAIEILKDLRKDHTELADTAKIIILQLGGTLDAQEEQEVELIKKIKAYRDRLKGASKNTIFICLVDMMELAMQKPKSQDVADAAVETLVGIYQDNKDKTEIFIILNDIANLTREVEIKVDKALDGIKDVMADVKDSDVIAVATSCVDAVMRKYYTQKDDTSRDKAISVLKNLKDNADDNVKVKANEVIVTIGGKVEKDEETKLTSISQVRNATLRGIDASSDKDADEAVDTILRVAKDNENNTELTGLAIDGLYAVAKKCSSANKSRVIDFIRKVADNVPELQAVATKYIRDISGDDKGTSSIAIESLLRIGTKSSEQDQNIEGIEDIKNSDSSKSEQADNAIKRLNMLKGESDGDKKEDEKKDKDQSMDVPQDEDDKSKDKDAKNEEDNTNSIPVEDSDKDSEDKKDDKKEDDKKEEKEEEKIDIEPYFSDVVKADGIDENTAEEELIDICKTHYESYNTAYKKYEDECKQKGKQPDTKVASMIYSKYCDMALETANAHSASAAVAEEFLNKNLVASHPKMDDDCKKKVKETIKELKKLYAKYLRSNPIKMIHQCANDCRQMAENRDYFISQIAGIAQADENKSKKAVVSEALNNILMLATDYSLNNISEEGVVISFMNIGQAAPDAMPTITEYLWQYAVSKPTAVKDVVEALKNIVQAGVSQDVLPSAIDGIGYIAEAFSDNKNPGITADETAGYTSEALNAILADDGVSAALKQKAFKTLCSGYCQMMFSERRGESADAMMYASKIWKSVKGMAKSANDLDAYLPVLQDMLKKSTPSVAKMLALGLDIPREELDFDYAVKVITMVSDCLIAAGETNPREMAQYFEQYLNLYVLVASNNQDLQGNYTGRNKKNYNGIDIFKMLTMELDAIRSAWKSKKIRKEIYRRTDAFTDGIAAVKKAKNKKK